MYYLTLCQMVLGCVIANSSGFYRIRQIHFQLDIGLWYGSGFWNTPYTMTLILKCTANSSNVRQWIFFSLTKRCICKYSVLYTVNNTPYIVFPIKYASMCKRQYNLIYIKFDTCHIISTKIKKNYISKYSNVDRM